jgi:methylglutaconyl-CoA hydratase
MTDFQNIQLDIDERGVASLWLNRPDKNNAFNAATIAELIQALDAVAADPRVRLLVLRGRGKHFCGGADLAWMQEAAQLDYAGNLDDAQQLAELLHHLHQLKRRPWRWSGRGLRRRRGPGQPAATWPGRRGGAILPVEVHRADPGDHQPFVARPSASARDPLRHDRRTLRRRPRRELGLLDECYAADHWRRRSRPGSPTCCRTARPPCAPARTVAEVGSGELSPPCAATPKTPSPASASAPKARKACAPSWKNAPAWQEAIDETSTSRAQAAHDEPRP